MQDGDKRRISCLLPRTKSRPCGLSRRQKTSTKWREQGLSGSGEPFPRTSDGFNPEDCAGPISRSVFACAASPRLDQRSAASMTRYFSGLVRRIFFAFERRPQEPPCHLVDRGGAGAVRRSPHRTSRSCADTPTTRKTTQTSSDTPDPVSIRPRQPNRHRQKSI